MRGKATYALLLACLAVLPVAPAHASLIWHIDLQNPVGEITSVQTVIVRGTLFNSSSSTDNLGVIGGFLGQPSGYDYEVGGFASIPTSPTGYSFSWGAGAGALSPQFDGVDLAPGESFDFVFGMFTPIQPVALGTYSGWFELQLFEAGTARPMVGLSGGKFARSHWTSVTPVLLRQILRVN